MEQQSTSRRLPKNREVGVAKAWLGAPFREVVPEFLRIEGRIPRMKVGKQVRVEISTVNLKKLTRAGIVGP
jgi:hypothetical protein